MDKVLKQCLKEKALLMVQIKKKPRRCIDESKLSSNILGDWGLNRKEGARFFYEGSFGS